MSSCSSCEPPAPPEGGQVSCASGSLDYIKELRGRMEAAGIPALAVAPSPGRGWGTKAHLLVEEADLPRVAAVMRGAWDDMIAREGNAPVVLAAADACPACGTAAPLVRGACSDCGLQLE